MIPEFKGITESEFDQLRKAIALITVLIAGADGNIQKEETEWAKKVTEVRSYSLPTGLKEFYMAVGKDFSEVLDEYIDEYNVSIEDRNRRISEKLAELNPILAKIESKKIASRLYKSYLSFAKHVAQATGGILGFFAVGTAEKKLISLPMLDKITYYINSEEEEE